MICRIIQTLSMGFRWVLLLHMWALCRNTKWEEKGYIWHKAPEDKFRGGKGYVSAQNFKYLL